MKSKWLHPSTLVLGVLLALGAGVALAQGPVPGGPDQPVVDTTFTYQGKLVKEGTPVTAQCDMTFSLWDALIGGHRLGSDSVVYNVPVNEGLFTVQVGEGGVFEPTAFAGESRWLEVEVRCPGDADYVVLSPRQELTAAPYAHGLVLPYYGYLSAPVGTNLFYLINPEGGGIYVVAGEDEAISALSGGPFTLSAHNEHRRLLRRLRQVLFQRR
jgi:hypothetical protein